MAGNWGGWGGFLVLFCFGSQGANGIFKKLVSLVG